MGYGFGVLLLVVGLVLVFALEVDIPGVGQETLGWILVLAGALLIVLTAVQLNARRRTASVATTTHPDGSQTVQQSDTRRQDPPPSV